MESFADRMCITGEVAPGTIISPEPILDCSWEGCSGGFPKTAGNYAIKSGSTTCTSQCFAGCEPYESGSGTSPSCSAGTCHDGSEWVTTYKAGAFLSLGNNNLTQYMTELSTNGPLQMCFNVYENFYSFFDATPTGTYSSYSGNLVGGHCVKLVGWDTDADGVDYWLIANSWDTTWGDKGFFRIRRGINLCNIEGQVSEGFTLKQAAARGIVGVIDVKDDKIVGGWHEQQPIAFPEVVTFAVDAVSKVKAHVFRHMVTTRVESQVVAGANFRIEATIQHQSGAFSKLHALVHRDTAMKMHLNSYELTPLV